MLDIARECARLLVIAWLGWALVNVSLVFAAAVLVRPSGPIFNGFFVHVPKEIISQLTQRELAAVVMHEHGHRAHLHVWKNLARRCLLLPYTPGMRASQELQADDYVTDPSALASALRKITKHPFDLRRAIRLDARSDEVPARAGDPTPGMGEYHHS